MTSTKKVCSSCNGFGHDKAARPVVKFEPAKDKDGRPYKRHITLKQGSGCMQCLGRGFTPCESEHTI